MITEQQTREIEIENAWADTLTRICNGKSGLADAERVRALMYRQMAVEEDPEVGNEDA